MTFDEGLEGAERFEVCSIPGLCHARDSRVGAVRSSSDRPMPPTSAHCLIPDRPGYVQTFIDIFSDFPPHAVATLRFHADGPHLVATRPLDLPRQ